MLRGYEYQEDLYVPGFFEFDIVKGESIYIVAGTKEINPTSIIASYKAEIGKRIPRNNFENCLDNAARQFFVRNGNKGSHCRFSLVWPVGTGYFHCFAGITLIYG